MCILYIYIYVCKCMCVDYLISFLSCSIYFLSIICCKLPKSCVHILAYRIISYNIIPCHVMFYYGISHYAIALYSPFYCLILYQSWLSTTYSTRCMRLWHLMKTFIISKPFDGLACHLRLYGPIVEARKLEHCYPHALKAKYRGSQHYSS